MFKYPASAGRIKPLENSIISWHVQVALGATGTFDTWRSCFCTPWVYAASMDNHLSLRTLLALKSLLLPLQRYMNEAQWSRIQTFFTVKSPDTWACGKFNVLNNQEFIWSLKDGIKKRFTLIILIEVAHFFFLHYLLFDKDL